MENRLLKKIEEQIKLFLENIKEHGENTQELSDEDEEILKTQLVDWLKIFGVVVPFVLIPGASILMPFLLKMAEKYDIHLMPTAFQNKEKKAEKNKNKDASKKKLNIA